jgi:hypothetical protein
MTAVLENVDRATSAAGASFNAPPTKYRSASSAASLSAIHTDIRNKTISSLDEDIRRVEDHLLQLKSVRDELKRIIG